MSLKARLQKLEAAANTTGIDIVIFYRLILPVNWRDVIGIETKGDGRIQEVDYVFKEGCIYEPQQIGNKLSPEEELEAEEHIQKLRELEKCH